METFRTDFSGGAGRTGMGAGEKHHADHPVGFIGVEGAVVVSARARNKQDVGRATLLAVLSALAVYLLVTLLSLGVVPRSELAEIRNPSMAGLMVNMMGSWGDCYCRRADYFRLRRVSELDHYGGGGALSGSNA